MMDGVRIRDGYSGTDGIEVKEKAEGGGYRTLI